MIHGVRFSNCRVYRSVLCSAAVLSNVVEDVCYVFDDFYLRRAIVVDNLHLRRAIFELAVRCCRKTTLCPSVVGSSMVY
jgi:hypothetical protein